MPPTCLRKLIPVLRCLLKLRYARGPKAPALAAESGIPLRLFVGSHEEVVLIPAVNAGTVPDSIRAQRRAGCGLMLTQIRVPGCRSAAMERLSARRRASRTQPRPSGVGSNCQLLAHFGAQGLLSCSVAQLAGALLRFFGIGGADSVSSLANEICGEPVAAISRILGATSCQRAASG